MGGGELQQKLAETSNSTSQSPQKAITDNNVAQPTTTQSTEQQNDTNTVLTNTLNTNAIQSNNVATTLADNKAEQKNTYQGEATNASFKLIDTWRTGNTDAKFQVRDGKSYIDWTSNWHLGIQGHFDLKTNDLKQGNKIKLGTFAFNNSTGDPTHNLLWNTDNSYLAPCSYLNNKIGNIYETTIDNSHVDLYLLVTQNNDYITPTISISNWLQNDIAVINYQSQNSVYKNLPDQVTQTISVTGGAKYNYILNNNISDLTSFFADSLSTVGTHEPNVYDFNSNIMFKNNAVKNNWVTQDTINDMNNTKGDNSFNETQQNYEFAYCLSNIKNSTQFYNTVLQYQINVLNDQGKLTTESINLGTLPGEYNFGHAYKSQNVGKNLTLADLKAKSTPGTALYSAQDDGSYLFYINIPAKDMAINKDLLTKDLLKYSKVVAAQPGALQKNIDFYINGPLKGRTFDYNIAIGDNEADVYAVSGIHADSLDTNTGKVKLSMDYTGKADDLQLHGQSAVKIHYINGQNGNEISQVDMHIGNANTNLDYQAKNPLGAGYALRNSTSNKLLNGKTVNGTVLSGNSKSSIAYPSENTVKDVYYIVDPQTQNITINYIDQTDNKQLKSDKISGYSDSKANYDVKTNISNYEKQGYKLIKSEVPSILQFDHNASKDQVYNVYLGYDKEQAKINYIDDTTGKILKSETAAGKVDSNIAFPTNVQDEITALEGQGYKLVSNSFNSPVYSSDANKNVFEVHFVHATSNVTQKVTIKRTINYLDKATNKAIATPVTQEVTFDQPGVQDMVTGQVNWQPVDSQQFAEVTSPEVSGYSKPDKATVEAQDVNVDSKDSIVNVYYTQNTPKLTINNNQGHKPSTPATKTKDNVTTTPTVNNGATVQLPADTTTALQSNNKQALAQTNVQSSNSIIGLAMAGGILILSLAGSVNKKKEN